MIVSIASGKGGTGKTLVATSLALTLAEEQRVQLLDCDVEEPDDHIFIRPVIESQETVTIPVPVIDEEKCTHCGTCGQVCAYHALAALKTMVMTFPELCHGCGACSYLCSEGVIREEPRPVGIIDIGWARGVDFVQGRLNAGEPMAPPVIRQVKKRVGGGLAIIDSSPGTSCPVMEAVRGSDFCLLVTDPTPFGINDLKLAVNAVETLGIPCGVVLNRSGEGDDLVEEFCRQTGIPILMKIPLDMGIARMYSRGLTLVEGMPEWKAAFFQLYDNICREAG